MKIAQQQSDYCTRYGQLAVQNNAGRSDSKTIDPQTLPDPWRWDWEKDPGTNCVFYKKNMLSRSAYIHYQMIHKGSFEEKLRVTDGIIAHLTVAEKE